MKAYLSGWESLCASSTVLRFIDSNLRGIGQVMFQDNPLSGALFLAAIVWGAVAAGMPQVAICGAIAVVVATLTAQVLRVDESMLRSGLYGFNGVLVGLALATFIAPGPLLWLVRRAGCRGFGRDDVRDGQRPEGLRAADPDVSVRDRHLAAAARHATGSRGSAAMRCPRRT